ncbi:hypothetical protein HH308_20840 [Gordonia sp. TBRC 11910]|uniref:Diadenosine tetraphosphate (Ap4A) HIT family hydrolase n=2 Tax=Gordonia asplenii TaxID=2725283 RepID=A0A848KYJ7_9ACTN|nr:hypothetical protein [Gordonia asplenii]
MGQPGTNDTVFHDDLWSAGIGPGMEVPGWIVLRTSRHTELITGIDDAEAATLGTRARDLASALSEVTGAQRVYQMAFGENHPHYHLLITARPETLPAARRGGKILSLLDDGAVDEAAARTLIPRIRAAYEQIRATAGQVAS